jgi:geranylgeranyl diphosphate synthase, type I
MNLNFNDIHAEIEAELDRSIHAKFEDGYQEYFEIINYQMGWEDNQKPSTGKRIRPILLLLTMHALGNSWQRGLPAAAALELIHNYSLIHDDIEDKSFTRRGKDAIWVRWGEAQAINAGDAMLNLAFIAPEKLGEYYSTQITSRVSKIIQNSSLALTKGQFLDISFETREKVSLNEYWKMVDGKTCSLIESAFEIGAVLAEVGSEKISQFKRCGKLLGRAYQIQDDWLGIWGDEALTGKSNLSDLCTRKKSFPILTGLEKNGEFAAVWNGLKKVEISDIPRLIKLLEQEGIKQACEIEFDQTFGETILALKQTGCKPQRLEPLLEFVSSLLERKH